MMYNVSTPRGISHKSFQEKKFNTKYSTEADVIRVSTDTDVNGGTGLPIEIEHPFSIRTKTHRVSSLGTSIFGISS